MINDTLNSPIYILKFESQFSDLLDFITFYEKNIKWQERSYIQSLNKQAKLKSYKSSRYFHELESIEYRFKIILSRKMRYSAIIAFVTTVEWVAAFISSKKTWELAKRKNGVNESVHVIRELIKRANQEGVECKNNNVDVLENIIKIRNCIAHCGGIINAYKYKADILKIASSLEGFSITDGCFAGDSIDINEGTIESIINDTQCWLIKFIEACRLKGIIEI